MEQRFKLLVDVTTNHTNGKFATREEIIEQIQEACSDPGNISANEGEYEVTSWEVTEHTDQAPAFNRLRDAAVEALGFMEGLAGHRHLPVGFSERLLKRAAKLRKVLGMPALAAGANATQPAINEQSSDAAGG